MPDIVYPNNSLKRETLWGVLTIVSTFLIFPILLFRLFYSGDMGAAISLFVVFSLYLSIVKYNPEEFEDIKIVLRYGDDQRLAEKLSTNTKVASYLISAILLLLVHYTDIADATFTIIGSALVFITSVLILERIELTLVHWMWHLCFVTFGGVFASAILLLNVDSTVGTVLLSLPLTSTIVDTVGSKMTHRGLVILVFITFWALA